MDFRGALLLLLVVLRTCTAGGPPLSDPILKEIAQELVSSAENSSKDWRAQYAYIEDIGDGRGYTAGIVGFCSGTGDMVQVVEHYANLKPEDNVLAKYLPALRKLADDGSASHKGLDPFYPRDWRKAAKDPVFQQAQEDLRDQIYFNPSVEQGQRDGLRPLGQFAYYDAAVMHGIDGMEAIRGRALRRADPPAAGGDETVWLGVYLDERKKEMRKEAAHQDTSRVDTEQLVFLRAKNFDLDLPLHWKVYGDSYEITHIPHHLG